MSRWASALVLILIVAAIAGLWSALLSQRDAAGLPLGTGARSEAEDPGQDAQEQLSMAPESSLIRNRTPDETASTDDPLTSAGPLVASGIIVDALGVPYEDARVEAGRPGFDSLFDAMPESPDAGIPILRASSDSFGQFELRGTFPLDSIEVRAEHADGVGVASLLTPLGTTDLRLVLERGGRIEGSLLLDDGIPCHGLSVSLTRQSDDRTVAGLGWDLQGVRHSSGEVAVESGRDRTFAFRGLKTDSYTARVATQYDSKVLVEVVGIETQAGRTTKDPRLAPVDLRGRVRSFEIRVIDEQRAAVPNGFLSWANSAQERPSPRIAFSGGQLSVITSDPAVNIEVGAAGFQSVRLAEVDGPREIVLSPGITVNCVLRGAVVPDAPAKLRIAFVEEKDTVKRGLAPGSGLIVNLEGVDAHVLEQLRAQTNCSYFDGRDLDPSGAVTLSVPKAGRYQVHWYIASPPSPEGEVHVEQVPVETPQWVLIESGTTQPTLELHLDPKARGPR